MARNCSAAPPRRCWNSHAALPWAITSVGTEPAIPTGIAARRCPSARASSLGRRHGAPCRVCLPAAVCRTTLAARLRYGGQAVWREGSPGDRYGRRHTVAAGHDVLVLLGAGIRRRALLPRRP